MYRLAGTVGPLTTTESAAELTARSSTKDNLLVTLRFLRTLAKNSAQIVDSNPAKIAVGLVKLIIDISCVCYQPFLLLSLG